MLVLLTGSTGFIGRALLKQLHSKDGVLVRAALRRNAVDIPSDIKTTQVGDLSPDNKWGICLSGADVVIHTAGRAHVIRDTAMDPLSEFRRVNVEGTLNLARQAVEAGVRRFIFISSIGVNGSRSVSPFTETDTPHPVEPYAISKFEAEQGLRQIAESSGMEVVIIRPPLVYGPNAPGNFGRLIRLVHKGIPLPLGAIHNKRSLVALDNLVDLIMTCLSHPAAANQTFLAGDGEDLSTTDLLRRIGNALGKSVRLFPISSSLLKLGASLIGKPGLAQRLCESLQVDISKARELMGWTPPVKLDDCLKRTAKHFLESQR
jgi:nucleoside-diphosphate-sugar epimerase